MNQFHMGKAEKPPAPTPGPTTTLGAQNPALTGVTAVLPTPFRPDQHVAFDDVPRLVNWAIDKGATAIAVTGTSGEAFRLSDNERIALVRTFCEAVDTRVPVVVGVGHLSTLTVIEMGTAAVAAGAAALLVPPPPIGTATESAISDFYMDVAREVPAPIIVQDDPIHLGVGLSAETVSALASKVGTIRYAKLEELPSLRKIRRISELTSGLVNCLGGSGGVYALEELNAGAAGIMTGFCFPEALVATLNAFRAGDAALARRYTMMISNLARLEALPGVSLSIRKHLYTERGALTSATLRSPSVRADKWTIELALAELRNVETEWAAAHAEVGEHASVTSQSD